MTQDRIHFMNEQSKSMTLIKTSLERLTLVLTYYLAEFKVLWVSKFSSLAHPQNLCISYFRTSVLIRQDNVFLKTSQILGLLRYGCLLLSIVCPLQGDHIDLSHLKHRLCDSLGFDRIRVTHQLA